MLGKLLVVDVEEQSAGSPGQRWGTCGHLGHLDERSPVTVGSLSPPGALSLSAHLRNPCLLGHQKGLETINMSALLKKNYSHERRPLPPYWAALSEWTF